MDSGAAQPRPPDGPPIVEAIGVSKRYGADRSRCRTPASG